MPHDVVKANPSTPSVPGTPAAHVGEIGPFNSAAAMLEERAYDLMRRCEPGSAAAEAAMTLLEDVHQLCVL